MSPAADAAVGWMARAIALAERGRHTCRPNPLVGCVLVRDGTVVGEGWHVRAGGPHAEIVALRAAGDRARGATAYVTLEPCDHTGRTGPCSRALLDAGVMAVHYAVADPHPAARGGATRLAAAGVDVEAGPLTAWARAQNAVFLHGAVRRRPYVTLKIAQTVDGALDHPDQRWITGPASRRAVHRLRARSDAVLVGSGTVLADDPRLDVRDAPAPGGQPRPVVFDARGRTPPTARIARPGAVVVTTGDAPAAWRQDLTAAGAEIVVVPAATGGGVDAAAALTALFDRDVRAVLAEPGPRLAAALLTAGVVDRVERHVATGVAATDGTPRTAPCLERAVDWPLAAWIRHGGDERYVTRPPDTRT